MHPSQLKQNIARILAAALVLVLILSLVMPARGLEFSGNCGENISWTLHGSQLTISGTGAMPDYTETSLAPWNVHAENILTVEVGEGITHIGNFAFMNLEKVRTVKLTDSVLTIGGFAFYNCAAMESIYLGNGLTEIGRNAFDHCRSLKAISFPGTLHTIRKEAFYRCESLLSVTIPASVTTMEPKIFSYCRKLRTATILANIAEVPYWTFYGCYALNKVSLSASITQVGTSAFENCENLTNADYGGSGSSAETVQQQIQSDAPTLEEFQQGANIINREEINTSTTVTETNGNNVTVEEVVYDSQDCVVETQKVTDNKGVSVTVNAVVQNPQGWEKVDQQVTGALIGADSLQKVQVDIYLDASGIVAGADLARFAKRDMRLTLHTVQGALWHIKCKELSVDALHEQYNFSYAMRYLSTPSEAQAKVIGNGTAYALTFFGDLNFNVELELPFERPRNITAFFAPEESGAYKLMQRSLVDDERMAHFYLAQVYPQMEYLIGIDVPTASQDKSDVIIPEKLVGSYGIYDPTKWVEEIPHLVSPRISSLGVDSNQLTWIIVGGMVALAVVVGIVVKLVMTQKFKHGYVPDAGDDAEDL